MVKKLDDKLLRRNSFREETVCRGIIRGKSFPRIRGKFFVLCSRNGIFRECSDWLKFLFADSRFAEITRPFFYTGGRDTPVADLEEHEPAKGHQRINTLWGNCIKNNAKMCIPDLDILVKYPIDYKFPKFCKDSQGEVTQSGFFPADPISLHIAPLPPR